MPTNKNQYGKSFADLAGEIDTKYSERYDPISMRGLKSEMTDLKDAQEVARAAKHESEAKASNLGKILAFGGPTDPNDPLGEYADTRTGEHRSLGQVQEDDGDFTDTFYQDPEYDRVSGFDKTMANYFKNNPVPVSGAKVSTAPPTNINPNLDDNISVLGAKGTLSPEEAAGMKKSELLQQGITAQHNADGEQEGGFNFDPTALRYAPVVTNALNLLGKKPEVETPHLNKATTTQSRFDKVDMSALERGITERGRAFTRANLSASGGNASGFLSNELASQINQLRATGEARLQASAQDTEIDKLNAAEQARVDSFDANIQSENNRMKFATDDVNARNLAASQNIKSSALAQIGTDLGNIGREAFLTDQVAAGSGYKYNRKTKKFTKDFKYGGYLLSKMKKKK